MSNLSITNVTIRTFDSEDQKLKAFATIVINDAFVVKDLKIIEGTSGRFVAMPSRKGKDGHFHDIAHPLHQDMRDTIERHVLQAYDAELSRANGAAERAEPETLAG